MSRHHGIETTNGVLCKALDVPLKEGVKRDARSPVMVVERNHARKYLTDGGLTPLDVMMTTMRHYAHEADKLAEEAIKARKLIANLDPNDPGDKALIADCIKLLRMFENARDKAVEVAVDAAPYLHPRLASVILRSEGGQQIDAASIPNDPIEASRAYMRLIKGGLDQ